jgi:hypothetical protein
MHTLVMLLVFLVMASVASAQTTSNTLTPAQLATLKADIVANSGLPTSGANRNDQAIADLYNLPASPDYYVWKSKVSRSEMLYSRGDGGTAFSVSGTGYVTRTIQELMLFESLFDKTTGMANPMNEQTRASFGVSMSGGTTPAPANRTHMQAVARRKVSRVERLFVDATTQACTGGIAAEPNGPCLMTFEGPISQSQIAAALNLP